MAFMDVMTIRLHLRAMRVLDVMEDLPERLVVAVRASQSWLRCGACGHKTHTVHETRKVAVSDLAVGGRPTTLVWHRRRFACNACGERTTEGHPAIEGRITTRKARAVVADVAVMSVAEVARRHGLSWHKVMELVHGHAVLVGRHRRRRLTRVVVIDEKSTHKGHHDFVTIVSDGETGAVIAVLEGRSGPVLERFLAAQGHRWRRGVEVVVTDLATCWKSVIAARLPHAAHVADRFHVVRTFLRVQVEFRRRAQASPLGEPHDPELFRSRFLQTKRADRLSDEERAQLDAILERHPTLRAAWNLVQHFHAVYEAQSPQAAMVALDAFADEYAKGLVDFGPAIRTLLAWSSQVLAFHAHDRHTNAVAEGVNTKIELLERIAYGFRNLANLRARILLTCPGHDIL